HVGPIGEINDVLRWPRLRIRERLDRWIAWLHDRAQRRRHDAVFVCQLAFAHDYGASSLRAENRDGTAGPVALGTSRSLPHHVGRNAVLTTLRLQMWRSTLRALLRDPSQHP